MARYGGAAVTDAGRDEATTQLREHYAAGQLSLEQFQDRLDDVYRAQTARELNTVISGLPHVRRPIPRRPWGSYPRVHRRAATHTRAALTRMARRVMLALGVLTAGSFVILALLVTALIAHGGLLATAVAVLLGILAAGVAGSAALIWLAWRLWRRHAWTGYAPPVAGPSWQSLAARAARLLLTSRVLWRLRTSLASRA